MQSQTDWLISLLMSWLPFIILIVVWIVLSRQMKNKGTGTFGQIGGQSEVQVAEMRRTNVLLERIAIALEKRAAA
jgi:ATP-dependent Zn protease